MSMRKIKLDSRAGDYVYQSLIEGGLLSNEVVGQQKKLRGDFNTYLPLQPSDDRLYRFDQGGMFSGHSSDLTENQGEVLSIQRVEANYDFLSQEIHSWLISSEGVAIYEDRSSRPNDEVLNTTPRRVISCIEEQEVYSYSDRLSSPDEILRTINLCLTLPSSAIFLIKRPRVSRLQDRKDYTALQIRHFSRFVCRTYIVGTYDGESFVEWVPVTGFS